MKTDSIVLGGGCFWCFEALFQRLKGVVSVTNGYSGGHTKNPSYEAVCTGQTGHAEVVKVVFDPTIVSLEVILEIFWALHDPTTLNQQGYDIGTEYRSVIFYQDDVQKKIAENSRDNVGQPLWKHPIVTEISPLKTFYPAEAYHQNYFNQNPERAYCQVIINPKVTKLKKKFTDLLVG